MREVRFTHRAKQDLEDIGDYIAADNPERARSFVAEIRARCESLGNAPLGYAARPELGDNLRACPHSRYVIFYRTPAAPEPVLIVRILHSARDLGRVSW